MVLPAYLSLGAVSLAKSGTTAKTGTKTVSTGALNTPIPNPGDGAGATENAVRASVNVKIPKRARLADVKVDVRIPEVLFNEVFGSYSPEESLKVLNGLTGSAANARWSLIVFDDSAGAAHQLGCFSLNLRYRLPKKKQKK